jgi:hypothetical protein
LSRTLIIGCGALAAEITALKKANNWSGVHVQCLDAALHNRPERIAEQLEQALNKRHSNYEKIIIAYADCGTGGAVDRVANRFDAERLPGAHCYEFFATSEVFRKLADAEPGTFYLTDFLARHFERLVIDDMKLDAHPELESMLFGHYRKVVYLAQTVDATLRAAAESAANRLGLPLEIIDTGYGSLASSLKAQVIAASSGH